MCSSFAHLISGRAVTASNTPVTAIALSRLLHVKVQRNFFQLNCFVARDLLTFIASGKSRATPPECSGGTATAATAGMLWSIGLLF